MSKYLKLKPDEIKVDHRYQRDLDEKRVEEIAAVFDPELFGVPEISKRENGDFYAMDGQTRIAAAIVALHGDALFLMKCYEGLSVKEESKKFLALNGLRAGVRTLAKFKARLEAEEPVALEIREVLKQLGCKITTSPQRHGVMAIAAIERAHSRGMLHKSIQVLDAWLEGDPSAFDGKLIDAMSAFFTACPDAEPEHLISRLEKSLPVKLVLRIRRESQSADIPRSEAAKFVLADIYNTRTARSKRVLRQSDSAVAA